MFHFKIAHFFAQLSQQFHDSYICPKSMNILKIIITRKGKFRISFISINRHFLVDCTQPSLWWAILQVIKNLLVQNRHVIICQIKSLNTHYFFLIIIATIRVGRQFVSKLVSSLNNFSIASTCQNFLMQCYWRLEFWRPEKNMISSSVL